MITRPKIDMATSLPKSIRTESRRVSNLFVRFKLIPEHTKASQPIRHYTITARPIKRLVKNQKSYFTDETGLIRFTTENRATARADTPLDDPSKYPARIP